MCRLDSDWLVIKPYPRPPVASDDIDTNLGRLMSIAHQKWVVSH